MKKKKKMKYPIIMRIEKENINPITLSEVVKYFGTQTNLAKYLGTSKQHVNSWCNGRDNMPIKYVKMIMKIMGKTLTVQDFMRKNND